jgi:3-hydroxyacyl-[acyl-carrier-protein] dehydratase
MVEPDFVEVADDGLRASAGFTVGAGADYLRDHFPGSPVLPGLLMLELAARAAASVARARSSADAAFDVCGVERLHVLRRVVPGEVLAVAVELDAETASADTLSFRVVASVGEERVLRAAFSVARIPLPCTACDSSTSDVPM